VGLRAGLGVLEGEKLKRVATARLRCGPRANLIIVGLRWSLNVDTDGQDIGHDRLKMAGAGEKGEGAVQG